MVYGKLSMKLTYKDWKDLEDSAKREFTAAEKSKAIHAELLKLAGKRLKNAAKREGIDTNNKV